MSLNKASCFHLTYRYELAKQRISELRSSELKNLVLECSVFSWEKFEWFKVILCSRKLVVKSVRIYSGQMFGSVQLTDNLYVLLKYYNIYSGYVFCLNLAS